MAGDLREGRRYEEGEFRASDCGTMLAREDSPSRGVVVTPNRVLITTDREILDFAADCGFSVVKVETFGKDDVQAKAQEVKLGTHRRALSWMLGL